MRTPGGIFSTIARFTDINNKGEDFTVLLDSIPAVPGHQIQSLASGPDGKVYVSVGDAYLDYENWPTRKPELTTPVARPSPARLTQDTGSP